MPGLEVIGAEEQAEVNDVFANGGVLFRHGFDAMRNGCYKVKAFEQAFARHMGVERALAVSSGTAALRVALAAFGLGSGDEVVTQSFTFVATVEAIIEAGATPVCADVDGTLNLDPESLWQKITPRTRAVIAVHMLGMPARLPEIADICRQRGLYLIEDTAWGCGGSLQGRPLGTWGDCGTFSFDFAKTMTTGEGGMAIFRDAARHDRATAWHDHGHENNPAVPRWEDTRAGSGFNFRMMELQGAVGLAQLRKLSSVVEAQRRNRDAICSAIQDLAGVSLRHRAPDSFDTADALVFFVPGREAALKCRQELVADGLATKILPEAYSWHFAGTWNHMPELAAAHGNDLAGAFPRSVAWLQRAVSIPVTVKMAANMPARIRTALSRALA